MTACGTFRPHPQYEMRCNHCGFHLAEHNTRFVCPHGRTAGEECNECDEDDSQVYPHGWRHVPVDGMHVSGAYSGANKALRVALMELGVGITADAADRVLDSLAAEPYRLVVRPISGACPHDSARLMANGEWRCGGCGTVIGQLDVSDQPNTGECDGCEGTGTYMLHAADRDTVVTCDLCNGTGQVVVTAVSGDRLPYRPAADALTLRLDRWASILRNYSDDDDALTLTSDECADLSTVLTAAANEASQAQGLREQLAAAADRIASMQRRLDASLEPPGAPD